MIQILKKKSKGNLGVYIINKFANYLRDQSKNVKNLKQRVKNAVRLVIEENSAILSID